MDEQKPKEFWLLLSKAGDYPDLVYRMETHASNANTVHAIEYSAYEKLKIKLLFYELDKAFAEVGGVKTYPRTMEDYRREIDLLRGNLRQRLTQANKMFEVLEDLDTILATALHNGHHDLIARVKEIVKDYRTTLYTEDF